MKVTIELDEDLNELVDIIAQRRYISKRDLLLDIIKTEAVKIGYEMLFKELEESYEKMKERRNSK